MPEVNTSAPARAADDADTFIPANVYEPQGMQWLVLGLAPGMEFLAALDTRALADAWLAEEYKGQTFDYYAIVKARDFYRLP